MPKVVFGQSTLGVMRYCPDCARKRKVIFRSQPDIGTVYVSGRRDVRCTEELSCGHILDTWIYATGTVVSIVSNN